MIQLEHISKTFRVSRRNAGLSEAFMTLFFRQYECINALDNISFTIDDEERVKKHCFERSGLFACFF